MDRIQWLIWSTAIGLCVSGYLGLIFKQVGSSAGDALFLVTVVAP